MLCYIARGCPGLVVSSHRSYLRALESRQEALPTPGSLRDSAGHIRPRPRHSSVSDYGSLTVVPPDGSVSGQVEPEEGLTLGTPEVEHGEDEQEPGSLSGNEVLEPAFRQNPLVDNDYVFGRALGRYCNAPPLLRVGWTLTTHSRVHGPGLILGILSTSLGSSWKESSRSRQ